MLPILRWIVIVALGVVAALWLVTNPGLVTVQFAGLVLETSLAVAVVAQLVVIAIVVLAVRWWRDGLKALWIFGRWRLDRRREKGISALTRGLAAVASGDAKEAARLAKLAEQKLDDRRLTLFLAAQAAQLNGDDAKARRCYEAMLDIDESAVLGLRGLVNQAVGRQDSHEVLRLSRQVLQKAPETKWALIATFREEMRQRQFDRAQETLAKAARAGAIPEAEAKRMAASVMIERSRLAEAREDLATCLKLAQRAVKYAPDFHPARLREAISLKRQGKTDKAARVIERAWPSLACDEFLTVYENLGPEDETPTERAKRLEQLVAADPGQVWGHLGLGRAQLEAGRYDQARQSLMRAAGAGTGSEGYRLLAKLERDQNQDEDAAKAWLAKIDPSAAEPTGWVCQACGTEHATWNAICSACEEFNTLAKPGTGGALATLDAPPPGPPGADPADADGDAAKAA